MSAPNRTPAASVRVPRGFGLVEIMIALAISAFLVAGAIVVFMQGRNTARTSDAASRVQETLRYALDTIEPDVRMAGFWGMTNRSDYVLNGGTPADPRTPEDTLVAGNCGVNFTVNLAVPVEASDGEYELGCAGTTPTTYSDVLVVRRASAQPAALTADQLQIQSNRTLARIFADGAMPAGFAAAPASQTHNLVVHAYYVSALGDGPNGLPQWALRRKTLRNVGGPTIRDEEIIRGIQDLQVQFGIDTDDDNNADAYVDPESPGLAGATVLAVRVWLLAVSEDQEQGYVNATDYELANQDHGRFDDGRRRVVAMKTIQLRNARTVL
jgi:type IV pilus assembly protein PilW